jgi:hypothetical protein
MEPASWLPLAEDELRNFINAAWERMTAPQRRLWEAIRIPPAKWKQHPYGDDGGGFWAVAVIGASVVWYNDIEDGLNLSRYSRHGTIDEYVCNQDELEWVLEGLLTRTGVGAPSLPEGTGPSS